MENNLFLICLSSFVGVFFVLIFLAIAMSLIMVMFPVKEEAALDDAPLVAAVNSAYARLYPGTKVTNIKEIK
jgi:hypothetical protein